MPTAVLLALLSLICPALLLVAGTAAGALYPEMSFAASAMLKLVIFIGSALAISYVFVAREGGSFSSGELVAIVVLCLFWALAVDYGRILAIVEGSGEFSGIRGAAGALGMAVAINLLMLHVAFGVVGRHFTLAILRQRALDESSEKS